FAILLVAFLAACSAPESTAPATDTNPLPPEKRILPEVEQAHSLETANLLNIGYGAAVVSRTAELTLDNSAVRAIDGDAESMWATPALDYEQTLVFSLPAPARIAKVGVRTPAVTFSHMKTASIDLSTDGATWTEVAKMQLDPKTEPQLFDITPRNAQFVRLRSHEGGARIGALQSVHVRGEWLAARVTPAIAGCWMVNGERATFTETSGRVSGNIGDLLLDGGRSGATYRFAWARGSAWGYALMTITPDDKSLSGIRWHEEAAQHSFGTSWFGDRATCAPAATKPETVVATFLRRAGWYPLFSLQFDAWDRLVEGESSGGIEIIGDIVRRIPNHRIRIVSREYHETNADANRKRTAARIESLKATLARRGMNLSNVDFVALGSSEPRRPTATEPMRLLYGVVEIEIPAEARASF
ncbi:MAG TPA: discoidin domain-containing protein, partial [Thermoanaerobaculia bacterium]